MAIDWTKWELNQTLMEYQELGLTDDPELSRILKFITDFDGKGWINARRISRKIPANELRVFMSKIVALGHAIDNGEPVDSSKYQIQIGKSRDIDDNTAGNHPQHQENVSPQSETKFSDKNPKSSNGMDLGFVPSSGDKLGNISEKIAHGNDEGGTSPVVLSVPDFVPSDGDKSETLLSPDLAISEDNFVPATGDKIEPLQANDYGNFVTNGSTFQGDKNLKIGDRVQWLGDILTIDRMDDEYVYGYCGSAYIQAPIGSAELLPEDKPERSAECNSNPVDGDKQPDETPPGMVIENDVVVDF